MSMVALKIFFCFMSLLKTQIILKSRILAKIYLILLKQITGFVIKLNLNLSKKTRKVVTK